jgi:hypothetical protein
LDGDTGQNANAIEQRNQYIACDRQRLMGLSLRTLPLSQVGEPNDQEQWGKHQEHTD